MVPRSRVREIRKWMKEGIDSKEATQRALFIFNKVERLLGEAASWSAKRSERRVGASNFMLDSIPSGCDAVIDDDGYSYGVPRVFSSLQYASVECYAQYCSQAGPSHPYGSSESDPWAPEERDA